LINDGFHAGRGGGDVLRGEASRVVRHLAGKSDDAVLGDYVDGGGFQERFGIKLGLNAGGDVVVARLVASGNEKRGQNEAGKQKSDSAHESLPLASDVVPIPFGCIARWKRRTIEAIVG
jgi:hypothetical protein